MFHRPKSEEKPEEKTVSKEKAEQPAKVESHQPQQVAEQQPAFQNQEHKSHTFIKEEKVMNQENQEQRESEERGQEAPAGVPFQRPPQMQRSVPGNFSGPYGGSGKPMADRSTAEDRRLVIGQGITMSGEIEACDYLLVEGTLEAALKGAKVLDIAESGTFYGSVEIEEATVAGRFEGELTVNGRLTIKSGGSVTGSVAYKELAVEAGATLDGKLSPLASMGAAQAAPSKKNMAAKNDNAGESDEGELPFRGNAAAAAE